MKPFALILSTAVLAFAAPALAQQQMVDPDFIPTVETPAWTPQAGPVVVIDEAHANFHRKDGQYAPFAALLTADGYRVTSGDQAFDQGGLDGAGVLVIANARPGEDGGSAFTDAEIAALEAWVVGGGRLLLIADHAPFGSAAERLGAAFGVGMGKGWAFEPDGEGGGTSTLVYSRENGRLGVHPITQEVDSVTAFTGQSLIAPEGATVLMRMGDAVWEVADPSLGDALEAAIRDGVSSDPGVLAAGGRAQGVAFSHGSGRVVVLGEAGMLSAQLIRFPEGDGRPDRRFGMNAAPGNARFGLNILHWLSEGLE